MQKSEDQQVRDEMATTMSDHDGDDAMTLLASQASGEESSSPQVATFSPPQVVDQVPDQITINQVAGHSSSDTNRPVPSAQPKIHRRPVPGERPIPNFSRMPLRRTSRGSSSRIGPHRYLSHSQTGAINPLRMNPTGLSSSPTMPLASIAGNPTAIDAKQINDKIDNMLVATKTLKPEPQPAVTSSSGKFSQFLRQKASFKKLFPSSLAGRLFSKGRKKDERALKTEDSGRLTESPPPLPDLHFNVGMNLRKETAEQLLTDAAQPKPPLRVATPFPGSRSLEDPFSEPLSVARPPTEFENRLRASPAERSGTPLSQNPFEAAKLLESDYDAILPSPPVASSTPPRGQYGRFRTFSESPTKPSRAVPASTTPEPKEDCSPSDFHTALETNPDEEASGSSAEAIGMGKGKGKEVGGGSPPRSQSPSPALAYRPVLGNTDWKKHPSPAQFDLEMLERAFRARFPGIPEAEDDGTMGEVEPSTGSASGVGAAEVGGGGGEVGGSSARGRGPALSVQGRSFSLGADVGRTRTIGTQTDGVVFVVGGTGDEGEEGEGSSREGLSEEGVEEEVSSVEEGLGPVVPEGFF